MSEVEPGGRAPAPAGLRLVQAFINTTDIEEGLDELGSPEQLGRWLAEHGLSEGDTGLTPADLRKAIEVREALRALALANNGEGLDRAASKTLNRLAADSRLLVRFKRDGTSWLEPAESGLPGALARILAEVHTAMIDGTWPRLKACRNDVCRWVFYDYSRNRSSTWCTMSVCGDRLKARAYRKRRRAG
jgi:predicted RNA-binding Zn ribbon-like protein